jgi:uncharacterized small protein (DUF1192 family)
VNDVGPAGSDSALSSAVRWLRGDVFEPHQEPRYAHHVREGNHSRFKVLLPLMLVVQILLAVELTITGDARATIDPIRLYWHDVFAVVHGAGALGAAVFSVALFRGGPKVQDRLPTVLSMAYFLWVCAVVGVDQRLDPKANLFGGACFGIALLVAQSPRAILASYAVGIGAYVLSIRTMQPDPALREALIAGGLTTAAFCGALALFLYGARRRDFRKTLLIEDQTAELADLNANLEQRVAEQVEALTRRAAEIERLNAQLQDQVKDRSRALANALRRLADGPLARDELEGRLIGDRFSIGRAIASGGMGSVFEGVDTQTGDSVAVKVIRSGRRTPVRLLERFLQEAEAVATVQHPAIVGMLHVDIDEDGTLFQVQELVRGETLSDALDRRGAFRLGPAARVLGVLCEALAAAHGQGVVHRDVKPANIMLMRRVPGLKLLDFGISKLAVTDASEPASTGGEETLLEPEQVSAASAERAPTRAGAVMGTPQYMSPEQRTDASRVTDRSDVYAVGVVAVLLFTGRLPDPAVPPAIPGLPIVTEALAVDPGARPSAAELTAAFHAFADGAGVPALEVLVAGDGLARDTTDAAETLLG